MRSASLLPQCLGILELGDGMSTVEYANVELYTRRLTWVDTLSSAVRCMTSRPIFVPSADSGRGLSSYLEEA
jgi:hypothetical protein